MAAEIIKEGNTDNRNITGNITITSPYENVIANCNKVMSSQKFKGGKESPKYALFGISSGFNSFWGAPNIFLGWYADKDQLAKEICELQSAIGNGVSTYELKYSVKVEKHGLSIKIAKD